MRPLSPRLLVKARSASSVLLAGLLLLGAGCGRRPPLELVQVTGRVQYHDGSAISSPRLEVVFIPEQGATSTNEGARVARGRITLPDATFAGLTTWSPGDGVVSGKHKVLVIAKDERGRPHPAVASRYTSARTTPLSVEVTDPAEPLSLVVEPAREGGR